MKDTTEIITNIKNWKLEGVEQNTMPAFVHSTAAPFFLRGCNGMCLRAANAQKRHARSFPICWRNGPTTLAAQYQAN